MFEDLYVRREQLNERIGQNNENDEQIYEQLTAINQILDPDSKTDSYEDELIDQWEADLDAGRTPDLNAEAPNEQ